METSSQPRSKLLPENAYTKLKPGEEYQPIVPASDLRPEVTLWSIGLGLIMVVIFSAACVYIALRAGNAIESSIPIAILAIFFGRLRKRRSSILENVMVQSVGQAAGVVAAGVSFVIPALYINELSVSWWQITLACTIGGFLGTVMIIPLRRYFVRDLHGELPFPEATAINEVLVTGEQTAEGAGKILLMAFILGGAYDLLADAFHLWNSHLSTSEVLGSFGEILSNNRMEISVSAIAALFGLGYIIGIKYASIIAAGSVLATLVLVPIVFLIGKDADTFSFAGEQYNLATLNSVQIFDYFVKPIGIGAIALAGLISILRMGKLVVSSISLGFKSFSKKTDTGPKAARTDLDMTPKSNLAIQLTTTLVMGVFFFIVAISTESIGGQTTYNAGDALVFALVGMLAGFLLSFLFTPVAAQAIAIVGLNPVSGMTLITVVLTIGALTLVGLAGNAGMIISLVIGTAVCTALSTSGQVISDFKIGYWIGSTPRNQQVWKFLGVAVAALVVSAIIPLMNESYHFLVLDETTGQMVSNTAVLPAPQANMLAAVARGLMTDPANQPWLLYGIGGFVALLLLMAGVPMLAFALGMYLPIAVNMSILLGAVCAWMVARTGKTEQVKKARKEQGILIASGLMAGAAIFGILTAALRLPSTGALIQYLSVGVDFWVVTEHGTEVLKGSVAETGAEWFKGFEGQFISLIMFVLLGFACYGLARLGAKWMLRNQKKEEPGE